jgi:hypothetical protein
MYTVAKVSHGTIFDNFTQRLSSRKEDSNGVLNSSMLNPHYS